MNEDQKEISNPCSFMSTDALIEILRFRLGTPTTTLIKIFITSEGYEIDETHRTAEGLKRDGISMRNVFGQFIGEE